jgi:hypothetical protein
MKKLSDKQMSILKQKLSPVIIKLLENYPIKLNKDEEGIYFLSNLHFLKEDIFSIYLTGERKSNDDSIIKYLIPIKENNKTTDENLKRWDIFYEEVKKIKKPKNEFKEIELIDELKRKIIGFDDYYIQGEKGFYSSREDLIETVIKRFS